jgi:hypothetical protein
MHAADHASAVHAATDASAMPAAAHASTHASTMPAAASATPAAATCERRWRKCNRCGKRTRDEATKNPVVHPESSVLEFAATNFRRENTTSRAKSSGEFK